MTHSFVLRSYFGIKRYHLIGLVLELFKVHMGSWSYPEEAYSKVFGVPLYRGFMYASVASYLCQAWRRLDVRLIDWPQAAWVVPLAAAIYLNFFTHHFWLPDADLFVFCADRIPRSVPGCCWLLSAS